MSEPPGPYDGETGPALCPPRGPYGGPPLLPSPQKRNLLPWLIVGGAVLLFGLLLLVVLLLTRDGGPRLQPGGQAASSTPASPSSSSPAGPVR
jgi:hypothetical protein